MCNYLFTLEGKLFIKDTLPNLYHQKLSNQHKLRHYTVVRCNNNIIHINQWWVQQICRGIHNGWRMVHHWNVHTDKFFWAHDIYKTGQNVWVSVNIFHDFLVDLAIKK